MMDIPCLGMGGVPVQLSPRAVLAATQELRGSSPTRVTEHWLKSVVALGTAARPSDCKAFVLTVLPELNFTAWFPPQNGLMSPVRFFRVLKLDQTKSCSIKGSFCLSISP